ncbi:MAG: outer membrane protein assembly factor BamC [Pseudomonadota bacterium]
MKTAIAHFSFTSRTGFFLLLPLALGGCSLIAKVPGMDRVAGEEGMFRDRQGEYLEAETIPRTQIPPEYDSLVIDDLLVIPDIDTENPASFLDAPRPRPLEGRSDREVVIQRMENNAWIVVDVSPSQVWPRIRDFWRERKVEVSFENPTGGVMDTGWFVLKDNIVSREKIRVTVDTGFQNNSAEIKLLHTSALQSTPAIEQVTWPEVSVDADLEYDMLMELSSYLADVADLYQATSVSFLAGNIPSAGKAVLVTSPDGEEVLRLQANFNRSWAAVGRALQRINAEIVSQDSATRVYEVSYTPGSEDDAAAEEEPGFFKKVVTLNGLFSKDETPEPQALRVELKASGSVIEVRILPSEANPEDETKDAQQRLMNVLRNTIA